ncbi:fatty-acid amide hydrolase 2-A-like isoform X2 [Nomia melanderi]|uniref:fatty-acid amide hydrolase 2-A-like isoform X2 n=1 Tax=Nomia melanderi TaxID=2448451 RepID=UPI001303FFD3|nr:fatty-acid amide hydrolase 2-A-like isoform X2 [Nomia melanderi]
MGIKVGTIILVVHKMLKFVFFLLDWLVTPLILLQTFRKRKRLPPIRNHLLLLSATELAKRIRRKEVSSEEAVKSYIERCQDVNPIVNAIVETRYDAAVQEARAVDEFLSRCTKTEEELARELPLLGLPITVKESIAVQGMSHSVGVKKKIVDRADEDADVVARVREAGAIVILVSNTPELCLAWESNNKVTGSTWNPYDTSKSAGGSSGGEAALLSSAASVVSLSSDIAGSARYPAMCCGIFGHKPSAHTVCCKGHKPFSSDENWDDYFSIGTMSRYAEDLPLMMSVISQTDDARRRFSQETSLKDMKFFYAEECCGITTSINSDMKAAIHKLRKYLEATYGAKVQQAKLPDMKYAFDISARSLLNMDVDDVIKEFEGPITSKVFLELIKYIFCVSRFSFSMVSYAMVKWSYSKFPQRFRHKMDDKAVSLKKQFDDVLGDNGVLIYPSFISPAHYRYQMYTRTANYTYMMLYNVLGLPVTQCPIGFNSKGLPVGVQIVANAGNDHLTIAMAREIEKAFGGWKQPPTTEIPV